MLNAGSRAGDEEFESRGECLAKSDHTESEFVGDENDGIGQWTGWSRREHKENPGAPTEEFMRGDYTTAEETITRSHSVAWERQPT